MLTREGWWCGVVAAAVAAVLVLAVRCEGVHWPCEPHGHYYRDTQMCICNREQQQLARGQLVYAFDPPVSSTGFNKNCCKHCFCGDPWAIVRNTFIGKRNHHADVRPLAIRDDREAVLQDMRVRRAVADDATSSNSRSHNNNVDLNIAVSLGAFDELQPRFPSCVVPGYDAEAQVTEEEGVALARSFVDGCASKWEWARQFHNPINRDTLVLSSWMSFRPDTQRYNTLGCTNPAYIAGWYESIMTMGLRAVVLHDCLSPGLVAALQNDNITFERVEHDMSSNIHFKQSPYDVRFVLYSEYLRRSEQQHLTHVLMTDMSDVRFRRDPFSAMRARPDVEIFIGAETLSFRHNPYVSEYLEWCAPAYAPLLHHPAFQHTIPPNCGVVGGQYASTVRLLAHVVKLYKQRTYEKHACMEPWERSCDMAMFAIALMTGYETLHEDVIADDGSWAALQQPFRFDSGVPFTSPFTLHVSSPPYYVIHK
ncbi:hypothetical protein PTSG_01921 [Salpingoeca rosetta]|uniref:Uncharacterized protein n=1 Tax=Salpingoeca rosetta (strain ATCC 50818 / BSB-021) TaxID=946362 RepID=F2TZC4_SALR5|nr:uncharacterized protein PTSG_01921 [Salpingoeca rosetta]EGD78948.1 hypothetical protein PTSG_01921 [Salpingoeca rosetta]|eukprot:XP_004997904.1 hypothetical protein PTSG_01921 [Salpingoeca rosetta]